MTLRAPGPGKQLIAVEMTEERKQRLQKLCGDLIDWLKFHTETPMEAHMVLEFTLGALAEQFHIEATAFLSHKNGAQA